MLLGINGAVRISRDIEISYTQSGTAIGKFSVVNSKKYKSQSGEQKEDVCFIEAVAFGRTAEVLNQYCRKGSLISIRGELQQENWTAQDGSKRSRHSIKVESIELLGSKDQNKNEEHGGGHSYQQYNKPKEEPQRQPQPSGSPSGSQTGPKTNIPEIDVNEDEIPF